jgi:ribosome biogenesis protein ERB1
VAPREEAEQQRAAEAGPPVYLLWADDGNAGEAQRSGAGLSYIPASKPQLPGHADSYNPPAEYLPTEVRRRAGASEGWRRDLGHCGCFLEVRSEGSGFRRAPRDAHRALRVLPQEEVAAWQLADPEDRPKALPATFPSLRAVPAYGDFIKERFERCLDLYLCPRVRRKRCGCAPRAGRGWRRPAAPHSRSRPGSG